MDLKSEKIVKIIVPGSSFSNGNNETANRILKFIDGDFNPSILFVDDIEKEINSSSGSNSSSNSSSNSKFIKNITKIQKSNPKIKQIFLIIHAYKSNAIIKKLKLEISFPVTCILILGGTDINIDLEDSIKRVKVLESLKLADRIVSFTKCMIDKINNYTNVDVDEKSVVIKSSFQVEKIQEEIFQPKTFLLIANFRPVKGILLALDIWKNFIESYPNLQSCPHNSLSYQLKILGKCLDDNDYNQKVLQKIGEINCHGSHGGSIHGSIILNQNCNHQDVIEEIQKSYCVINTSESEGMSQALVNGMGFGKPVLAGNIEANLELLMGLPKNDDDLDQDLKSPMDPKIRYEKEDFIEIYQKDSNFYQSARLFDKILTDREYYEKLSYKSKSIVGSHHKFDDEREKYKILIEEF